MVSTPSRFAVSSAANRVAADIERTVQRHTAAACKRNQFGHTFLIKIALRREHADDNAVRAERGKALHLTAEQLKFAFRIQKIAAARTQQHTNRYGNPFPHHAEQILIRRSTADH